MDTVYFVYFDHDAVRRFSDGVEFCIVTDFFDDKIYFLCRESQVFWSSLEDIGDFDKTIDFSDKLAIRAASLIEICKEELINYVDFIKVYEGYKSSLKTTCVYLKDRKELISRYTVDKND